MRTREIFLTIALFLIILTAGALLYYFFVLGDVEMGALRRGDSWSTVVTDGEGEGQERYQDDDGDGGAGEETEIERQGSDEIRREAIMRDITQEAEDERNFAEGEAMESGELMEGFDSRGHLG
ncbi:hypothetical protein Vi05172_g8251 [Venturia inaequalis]|nr:hypothetical protein Vi05172_g8251 [Venturia inaequalis]